MSPLFLTSFFLIIFCSCNSKEQESPEYDYSGFTEKRIILVGRKPNLEQTDTLCSVSIKLPIRLDTFYKWNDYTDYSGGHYAKYRFSDRRYIQYPESGFYYTLQPDSVYQLSIWHKLIRVVPDTLNLSPLSEDRLNEFWYLGASETTFSGDSIIYIKKEFRVINNRPFIITAYITPQGLLTWKPTIFLVAATNLPSRELFFIGECCAKDTAGFMNQMYKSMMSIKIEENNWNDSH